ncbi:12893_t:CDS:2 [Ambispora gerdemannii]|uniref:12893_t:CDS:1 n=1 Tax=Ambispora gerdemannii TaxID=144530 RepID=A0A9N8V4Y7_9GLOM|nr:12893_t:CDS:2 [Ambispora gerdemannii]
MSIKREVPLSIIPFRTPQEQSSFWDRQIVIPGGFNKRTMPKLDYNTCSKEQLQDLLERNTVLMNNSSLMSNLSDKGEKIHKARAEILKALSEFNNDDTEMHIINNNHTRSSEESGDNLNKNNASKEEKSINDLRIRMNRMAVDDSIHVRVYNDSSANNDSPRQGKYVKPVRLKIIPVEEASELEEKQIRLQKESNINMVRNSRQNDSDFLEPFENSSDDGFWDDDEYVSDDGASEVDYNNEVMDTSY